MDGFKAVTSDILTTYAFGESYCYLRSRFRGFQQAVSGICSRTCLIMMRLHESFPAILAGFDEFAGVDAEIDGYGLCYGI